MGKKYVGQTALTLRAKCNADIAGWQSLLIKYRKPDKTTYGSFQANIYVEETGVIEYEIQSAIDLDQAGNWTFWAHITFADGTVIPGEPYTEKIYEEGK